MSDNAPAAARPADLLAVAGRLAVPSAPTRMPMPSGTAQSPSHWSLTRL